MTTLEAYKALYAAFGGSADDVADITRDADMIKALADYIATGGAAELPAVKAADNGKVLMVVEGSWAAASIPSPTQT